MKNGEYILVDAPDGFPYKRYRGKYAYEHIVNYWKHYGEIPEGYIVHHIDGNKHNNSVSNLRLMRREQHITMHNTRRGTLYSRIQCGMCLTIFDKKYRTTQEGKGNYSGMDFCSRRCSGRYSSLSDDYKNIVKFRGKVLDIYMKYPD